MKLCVVGDLHFTSTSSIIRSRGNIFSTRLENCIDTLNFVEQTAVNNECDYIIYLGDFFDKDILNSEELTALQSVQWSAIPKILLVGNHEMGAADLSKSSAHILNLIPNCTVVDSPNAMICADVTLLFIPYMLESCRPSFDEIKQSVIGDDTNPLIVFSHNDIRGISMGRFVSEIGFSIDEISSGCNLFFNGHIHNEGTISKNAYNVGNITGLNFSEDCTSYIHKLILCDTDDMYNFKTVVNPYAFNFLKCDINDYSDYERVKKIVLEHKNIVASLKVVSELCNEVREMMSSYKNVVCYRITEVLTNVVEQTNEADTLISSNHIEEFVKYVLSALGSSEIVKEELQQVVQ